MRSPIHTRVEDLPHEIAVFPLPGALLLPGGRLPLNIFEPRYLNMTLDSLAQGRLFGMIQPNQERLARARATAERAGSDGNILTLPTEPPLYSVGCLGRVASFEESEDGRLVIALKGLLRFRVVSELEGRKGYRRVRANYEPYLADLEPAEAFNLDRDALLKCLKPYFDAQGMKVNFDVIKNLSDATLVTSLCMICPFEPSEKQALLEAETFEARAKSLTTLLTMGAFDAGGKPDGPRQ
jgi:Lon protease-like protein